MPSSRRLSIEARTFNDCPFSILTVNNNHPTFIEVTDAMDPSCGGFANLHGFSLSEDGGLTAAAFDDNANFHFATDVRIEGPGEGEGGLRISPWSGQHVDGRFRINAANRLFEGRSRQEIWQPDMWPESR